MRSALTVVSLLVFGCAPAASPLGAQPTVRATGTQGDVTVKLASFEALSVGQNRVFYQVLHEGAVVPHAELMQHPMRHGAGTEGSCPMMNPEHAPSADGFFEGLLIFTAPSSAELTWRLSIDVELSHDGVTELVDLGVLSVADSPLEKVLTRAQRQVVVTLGAPAALKVGSNEIVVSAHEALDGTEWAPVNDLHFHLTPATEGDVAPALGEDGLYRGAVVFGAPGDQVLHVDVEADETITRLDFPVQVAAP